MYHNDNNANVLASSTGLFLQRNSGTPDMAVRKADGTSTDEHQESLRCCSGPNHKLNNILYSICKYLYF
jgi:hypothetical protein